MRGRGIGKALLKHLARRCVAEGLARMQWWVLDWNESSINVYRAMGARPMDEWTVYRVSGAALDRLAR
jgi:GNAT superfamily N-acetyltransferase